VDQPIKKQFIAGAVCPKCGAMDRIVMYKKDRADFRECVSCDFSDELHIQSQTRELETRVNTPEEVKKSETQVLVFKPAGSK
jgi:uncharacterized metal-binding protein (TIGR02443 family)